LTANPGWAGRSACARFSPTTGVIALLPGLLGKALGSMALDPGFEAFRPTNVA
jgi:hypothetical protein